MRALLLSTLIVSVPVAQGAARRTDGADTTPHYGTIYLLPRHPVYEFLDRLRTKGLLLHAPLSTKPWTRMRVAATLLEVPPNDARLTSVDRARWWFYIGEFAGEIAALGADSLLDAIRPAWWSAQRADSSWWKRPLSEYRTANADGRLWIAGGFSASRDTGAAYRRHAEIGGWLRYGGHWGAQAAMRDISEWGNDVVPPPAYGPSRGVGYLDGDSTKSLFFYDDPDAAFTYGRGMFAVSLAQYPLVFGPGKHAQVVLSDNAPPGPQIRLTISPWPWLTFTYVHMSLQSGVPDTAGFRHRYLPAATDYLRKYYVAHRLELTLIRGVDIGLGESVVYGGRGPVVRYLIPVIPFRAAQHDEGDLDNLQMWGDMAVTRLRYTRLYGALLIDELSLAKLFSKDNIHNWWAWQIGVGVEDAWGLAPDVGFGIEYTRANPWVYHHKYPWNTYDTWAFTDNDAVVAYPLGFWQGHNGDYVRADLSWRVRWNAKLTLWASQARRGGEGTVEEQYNPPAEPFLFGPVTRTREMHFDGEWEVVRDLFLRVGVGIADRKYTPDDGTTPTMRRWTVANAGVTYNVW